MPPYAPKEDILPSTLDPRVDEFAIDGDSISSKDPETLFHAKESINPEICYPEKLITYDVVSAVIVHRHRTLSLWNVSTKNSPTREPDCS
jgi:hypothetical protein